MLFQGIRVLDLTKVFSGPLATRMLSDYGAEVIKIENPHHPDDTRQYPPLHHNSSGYFEILNHNKKSITLDLKTPTGLHKFYQLVQSADIVVENLTPSAKHHLQIDYSTLKPLNPRLIYASISGLGQSSSRKYYDLIAQAESGLISLSGTHDTPVKIGPAIIDAYTGTTLAFALAAALYHRSTTSAGQYLDVSMLGAAMNLLEQNLVQYQVTHHNPPPPGNQDNAIAPFGLYRTQNSYLALAVGNDQLWDTLATFLTRHQPFSAHLFTTNSLRLQHQDQLTTLIESVFKNFTSSDLIHQLRQLSIPCAQVAQMSDVANNPTLYSLQALRRVHHPKLGEIAIPGSGINFSNSSPVPYQPAPTVGQHNSAYGI
jgi:crotonobetainyl-CoA:carnitine CoA-transferase CaiB-like acyl-CoA transferase